MEKRLDIQSIVLLVLLTAVWGITFPAMKVALRGFPPILLGGLRFLLAGILVTLFGILRRERLAAQTQRSRFLLIIYALTLAVEIVLLLIGVQHTFANRSSILFNTSPFWVLALAIFFLPHDHLPLNKWIGTGLAFIGVAALFAGRGGDKGGVALLGDALVLGAAGVWGVRIVLLKYFPKTLGTTAIQVWQFFIAGPLLTVLGISVEKVSDIHLSFPVIMAFLYLAIISNAFGFMLWTYLVQKEVATKVAPFMFLTPVFGVLASAVVLREVMTDALLMSLALVGTGIFVANRQETGKMTVKGIGTR
ncbi:MAG: EamA family transporter [Proteobacteria bacterium]|nr:EamA family transporter [Pseudomonadota bacterium]